MKKTIHIVMTLILLATLFGVNIQLAHAVQPLAATTCQCVVYIKNKYNLTGSAGYAKNMGIFLRDRGFWKLTVPRRDEIIVMKPLFGQGVSATAGHVGIIQSVVVVIIKGKPNWKVTIRGANQPGSKWTESNCNNVSFWTVTYPQTWKDTYVEYWVKGTH